MALSASFWGSNASPTPVPAPAPTQSKAPGGVKGFLVRNLPAIGGTLGAVAGLPLNALDAVTGVGGTALDAGAAAGGAGIGEALKEKILGQGISPKQVAIQAGESGILSGVGRGIGLAGKAAGSLAKVGLPATAEATEGAAKVAAPEAAPALSNPLQKLGVGAVNRQAQANAAQKAVALVKPFEGVSKDITDNPTGGGLGGALSMMRNTFKVDSPETIVKDMASAHDLGTGETGLASNAMKTIVKNPNVGKVQTDGAIQAAKDAIGQAGIGDPGALKTDGKDVLDSVRNVVTGNAKSTVSSGVGNASLSAPDALSAIQKMEKTIRNTPVTTDKGAALVSGLKAAKTALEDELYNGAGVDAAAAKAHVTPEAEAAFRQQVADSGLSKEYADHIVNGINNATSGQEIRSLQAPLVEMGQLSSAAKNAAKGSNLIKTAKSALSTTKGGSGMGNLSTVYEGGSLIHGNVAAIPALAAKATRTGIVQRTLARLAPKTVRDAAPGEAESALGIGADEGAQVAPTTPSAVAAPTTPGSLLGNVAQDAKSVATLPVRMAGVAAQAVTNPIKSAPVLAGLTGQLGGRVLGNVLSTGTINGQPDAQVSPQEQAQDVQQLAQQSPDTNSSASPGGQTYSQANMLSDIQRDPKNASSYEALYKLLQPAAPTATEQSTVSDIQSAGSYLDTIEQEMSQLGGTNALKGNEANIPFIGKYLQPDIKAYDETKFDAATALAKALTGRAATSTSIKLATQSLPSPTDSPEQAAQKLANLRLELSNKASVYGATLNGASQ